MCIVLLKCELLKVLNIIYSLDGFCGKPGLPHLSKIIPNKESYSENETLFFQCDNKYIDLNQTKQCMKGKWFGNTPICGTKYINIFIEFYNFYENFTFNND